MSRQHAVEAREKAVPVSSQATTLDAETKTQMQQRLGFDFSSVRIHADAASAQAAEAVGATAFTVGRDVVFGQGAYAPGTPAGDRLIAHELTHVVQNGRFGPGGAAVSDPGDAAEREAEHVAHGGQADVRHAPTAVIARDSPALAPKASPGPGPTPPVFNVFEEPDAAKPAGAPKAFDKYIALDPADKVRALKWSSSTGRLRLALQALGPTKSADPKYQGTVQGILRWIEKYETRQTTGLSDADMAKKQSGVIKEEKDAPPGWGGNPPNQKTRFEKLLPDAQKSWTARGTKVIAAMVAHAQSKAPELKLTTATFELDFNGVDASSVGAMAVQGSKPGQTITIGFEFIVAAEVDPAYALSTVVHELQGHPMFDEAGGAPNYAGKVYQDAAGQVPASKNIDRSGSQTFNYWPSEIYSLLKEIPYWTAVTADHAKKKLNAPGNTTTADVLNFDPRGQIKNLLREIKSNWEPTLVNGMVRGLFKRVQADPSMQKASIAEFESLIKQVFPDAAAKIILK